MFNELKAASLSNSRIEYEQQQKPQTNRGARQEYGTP